MRKAGALMVIGCLVLTMSMLIIPVAISASTSPIHNRTVRPNSAVIVAVLAKDGDQRGYLGGYTQISIGITYDGVTANVKITTRSDAHAALGAALFGLYDIYIHKFRGFGGGSNDDLKDGCTFANWECYDFNLVYKYGTLSKYIDSGGWLHVKYHAVAKVEVIHYPHWLAPPEKSYIYLSATPEYLVVPGAYSHSGLTVPVGKG